MKLEIGKDKRKIRLMSEALASKRRIEILGCINGELSHTEIAEKLDLKDSSTTYHIRKLLDADLIEEYKGRKNNRASKVPIIKHNKIVIEL